MLWDEAFYAIATGRWTRGDDDAWRLGSLTKLWACPGLRLGYVIAPSAAQAQLLRARQPRWSVNGLALAALPRLLAVTNLAHWSAQIAAARGRFADELRRRGLDVDESAANWVLVRRPGLRAQLAPRRILVRDCTSFGLPHLTRIAVPHPTDLERVLDAVDRLHT